MDQELYQNLLISSKKNYIISQIFTYVTGILILATLYLYHQKTLYKYDDYFYYAYLGMAIISIILSLNFGKKLKINNIIIKEIVRENESSLFAFAKNGVKQGCINAILIIVLISSFFVQGTQLAILNAIFFMIIIFSYWVSNRFYFTLFSRLNNNPSQEYTQEH